MAVMLLSSTAGVGAAAVAWDNETTSSTTTSDVHANSASETFYPGNSTKKLYVETDGFTGDPANLKLAVKPADEDLNGTTYASTTDWTATNSTAGHYAANLTHQQLADVPRAYYGALVDVQVINTSSSSIVLEKENVKLGTSHKTSTTALIRVSNASGSSAVEDSNAVADELTVKKQTGIGAKVASILGGSTTTATVSDSVAVDGANTTVQVMMADSETASAFDAAAKETSSGDWIVGAQMMANNQMLKVYNAKANVSSGQAYATYDPSSDTLTLHQNGDKDFSGTDSIAFKAVGGDGYDIGEMINAEAFSVTDIAKAAV